MSLEMTYLDIRNTPIEVLLSKFIDRFKSKFSDSNQLKKDKSNSSFLSASDLILVDKSIHLISIDHLELSKQENLLLKNYTSFCIDHRFDILGSAWCYWGYSDHSIGLKKDGINNFIFDNEGDWLNSIVNQSNLSPSKSLWKKILSIDPDYQPIDWQIDVLSGHRYDSKRWFRENVNQTKPVGTDIKIPWELSRLQHLIRMLISSQEEDSDTQVIIKEVQCQLIDFVMSNPPRWGVNWSSTMEVSIRAANMAFVLHLLNQRNVISEDVKEILSKSIHEHLNFINQYDERKNGLGNNHYLSNLAGYLCAASVFQENEFLRAEIERKGEALIEEINKQFLDDGGNFESSTTYHCLSLEMALYGMFVINEYKSKGKVFSGLDQLLIDKANARLFKAGELLKNMTRSDNSIPQFGDNDSARFIKLGLMGELMSLEEAERLYLNKVFAQDKDEVFLDEDMLNYSSCKDLVDAYFNNDNERHDRTLLTSPNSIQITNSSDSDLDISISNIGLEKFKYEKRNEYRIETRQKDKDALNSGMSHHFYPLSGYYIFKGDRFHLMINGSNRHVKQYWPHAHNDKLSFDLYIDGQPIFRDPGSFTYTGDVALRNKYRAEEAHNGPIHLQRQNIWPKGKQGVFRTINKSSVDVVRYSDNGISLLLKIGEIRHLREWIIKDDCIEVIDRSNRDFDLKESTIEFSPGYGKRLSKLT